MMTVSGPDECYQCFYIILKADDLIDSFFITLQKENLANPNFKIGYGI